MEVNKIAVMMAMTECAIELAAATGVDAMVTYHPIADAASSGGVLLKTYLDTYNLAAFELHEAFHGLHPGIPWLHGHKPIFIIIIIITMILKREVVLSSLIGIFIIGLIFTGSLVGADIIMVSPAKGLMSNPKLDFWVLGVVMYLAAVFFWPTPATALVGTILIPLAIKSGLPPISAAMSVNILGHGMALSGDWVLQGAPGLAERTIGLTEGSLVPYVVILSIITGTVASIIAFAIMIKDIKNFFPVVTGLLVSTIVAIVLWL